MTSLKETLDVGQVPVAQGGSRPKPESGHLRSDAVSLDVPVKVHGSRVVEVVRGTTQHTEPFEERTNTMIVFPLGGVLKMTTQVSVGQAIVLTNLKTRQDAICRVVKTRTNPNQHSYVEVEFSHPQPGYWGVRFPSDGPETLPKPASPVAATPVAPVRVSPPPAVSPPAPRIEIPEPEVSKTEIPGIQASEQKVASPANFEPPASVSTPDSASFSLEQLRGDPGAQRVKSAEPHHMEIDHETESPVAGESAAHEPLTFGRFAAGVASSADHAPARPAFGAGLEYGPLGATAEKGHKQGKNSAVLGACVGLLVAAIGGGAYYFLFLHHASVSQQRAPITAPAVRQAPLGASAVSNPAAAVPAPSRPAPAAPTMAEASGAPAETPSPSPQSAKTEPSRASAPAPSKQVQSPFQARASESPKSKPAPAVPDMFGALNAHPTTAVRSGSAEGGAAPSVGAGALSGQSVALPSAETMPANLPPPPPPSEPASEEPVRVGGDVKPPKLISSPPVIYPEMARQTGISGDVVVRIVIDKSGKVSEAKAISGPVLLRAAAVSALRDRKYVPSQLDGRPISVEMLVTIQFHR
jgi:TonB family protein